jgi:hypothetical protein
MKSFRLIFHHLREDGVNLNPASRLVLDSGPRGRMTAIGNSRTGERVILGASPW